jgi:hypothetical protein
MRRQLCSLLLVSLFVFGCTKSHTESSSAPTAAPDKPVGNVQAQISSDPRFVFTPLLSRVWRVSKAPHGPASGSIFIFLPNGTLLETSCVETYRIAVWSVDRTQPDTLIVVEDQRPAFTATLSEATSNALHLYRKLAHGGEVQEIALTAVDGEFVCPDLPKK